MGKGGGGYLASRRAIDWLVYSRSYGSSAGLLGGYDHLFPVRLFSRLAVLSGVEFGALARRELSLAQVAEVSG